METVPTLYIILFFIGLIILMIITSLFLQRRGVIAIINNFRKKNALAADNAIVYDEVGIKHQHVLFKKRDYKQQALQFLITIEVIRSTETGGLYLSETKLASINRESTMLTKILLPK